MYEEMINMPRHEKFSYARAVVEQLMLQLDYEQTDSKRLKVDLFAILTRLEENKKR